MKFSDYAKIFVKAGKGGNGAVSFRREKFIEYGGPDGGDGGRGGSIYAVCADNLNTLIDFRFRPHIKAKSGQGGMGKQRYGKGAEDVELKMPPGTQITDEETGDLIADLTEPGERVLLAKGGKGGLGNLHFKSSTNQAPRQHTLGEPGEERTLLLQLKMIADAGLLGLPNAGKSTFVAAVTAAKPKIADYPFTTLAPQLGVVRIGEESSFVLADIPGLIEGASQGVGLGHEFLRHVERCRVLLHLVDATQEDVAGAWRTVRAEVEQHTPELAEKPELLALSKIDALDAETLAERRAELEAASGGKVALLSAVSGEGVQEMLAALFRRIRQDQEDDAL